MLPHSPPRGFFSRHLLLITTLCFCLPICRFSNGQSVDYHNPEISGVGQRIQPAQHQIGPGGPGTRFGTDPRQQQSSSSFGLGPLTRGQQQQQVPLPGQSPLSTFGHQNQQQQQRGGEILGHQQNSYDLYGRQQPQQQRGKNSSTNGWMSGGAGGTFPNPASGKNATFMVAGKQPRDGDRGNVQVEIQLRSFANPGFRLSNGRLCTCPSGNVHCLQTSQSHLGYTCLTSFSVFILSADDELHFEETPYYPLNAAGQLGQQEFGQKLFHFQLDTEPRAIGVIVHNLGPQINPDGIIYHPNTVTRVDTFLQSLSGTSPSAAGFFPSTGSMSGQQNAQIQGEHGTQLSISYSVSCRGARTDDGRTPLVGPGCVLACNSSTANPTTATCQNQRTGFFSLCRWTNGNAQVTDCKHCPWGIRENAYCADEQGGVLEPNHAGVVSNFYYSAFVVLCCLCGLLLLCMVVACVLNCTNILRIRRRNNAPPFRQQSRTSGAATSTISHRGDPERAALTSAAHPPATDFLRLGPEDGKGPPPYSRPQNGVSAAAPNPLPLPRSNASTASAASGGAPATERQRFPPPLAIGTKSPKTLSPPRFQPLPHLGPPAPIAGTGADSLNSSYAGLPPPSVSADV